MTGDERRNDDRLPVIWKGELVDNDDNSYPCEVRDISWAGTLITCEHDFAMGTELLLLITEIGEFAGKVKWAGSGQLGLYLMAGSDLELKKFAEAAGCEISEKPMAPEDMT